MPDPSFIKTLTRVADAVEADTAASQRGLQPDYGNGNGLGGAFGAPHVREGEDPLTSRPFSFLKLFGATKNGGHQAPIPMDQAKVEIETLSAFHTIMRDHHWQPNESGYLVPLGNSFLEMDVAADRRVKELRQRIATGAIIDQDESAWLRKRAYAAMLQRAAVTPAQSWLDATLGGDIVPLPAMGEIIELLRNREALMNAGCRVIPLPPQGSIKFPKIMTASQAAMRAENQTAASSVVGTGSLILAAKKCVSIIDVPNELFRYATPAAEAVLREDMAKSLALTIDQQCLEGPGDSTNIKGLINYPFIVKRNASRQGSNGDTLLPQDGYLMAAAIEENNVDVAQGRFGWLMRPLLWAKIVGFRADSVTAGDQAGTFVQALIRSLGDGGGKSWCEFPVTKTTQLNRTRVKGQASNLTYLLGGQWEDYYMGIFGGIEFLSTNVSDLALTNDLTRIRGIMLADGGPRHEGAFGLIDNLIYAN